MQNHFPFMQRTTLMAVLCIFMGFVSDVALAQGEDSGGEPFELNSPKTPQTKQEKDLGEIFLEESGSSVTPENLENEFNSEKNKIDRRLRQRYVKKVQDRRKQKERVARLKRARDKQARRRYLEEKSFRRRSLLDDGLQSERLKEESLSGLIPRAAEGSARFEYRHFTSPKQESRTIDQNISLLAELETGGRFRNFELKIWNMGRYDVNDKKRTGLIPYENWLGYKTDRFQFKAGTQIENWAMTEVFTPSDVFNSRNIDSQFENAEKIGEPSISARFSVLGGYATFYYMPLFMGPILPSEKSRFSSLPPDTRLLESRFLEDSNLYESYKSAHQYAARFTRKVGPADLALHYINHIDRQQPFIGQDMLFQGARPIFLPVTQMGLNGSAVLGESIYKFDFVQRNFKGSGTEFPFLVEPVTQKDHSTIALGYERPYAHENGWESTGFFEWQKILNVTQSEAQALSTTQNDVMLGYRLTFNDPKDKEVRAFLVMDLDNSDEMFWVVSYNQKLVNKLKVAGGFRQVISGTQGTRYIDDADHGYVNFTYFF